LIAEEVAEGYPDLAVEGADGQELYQELAPMLLNESLALTAKRKSQ
jgi:hypothetical protein